MDPVYLDHAATTPLDPGVLGVMLPYLSERFGNASSVHARGREARHAVEQARSAIAAIADLDPGQVWFTSGGTEANNTAIRGVAARRRGAVVTGAAEHESVLRSVERLAGEGRDTVLVPPGADGSVDPEEVLGALTGEVALVSLMRANNEVGTLTAVREIAAACRERGVPMHVDAVQSCAYESISPGHLGVDLVTVSAHKIGGPAGVGALLVAPGVEVEPLIVGGGQERGRRAGTENVATIVGFAEALRLAAKSREREATRIAALRNHMARRLAEELGDRISITTPLDRSAPHILHCTFPGTAGRRTDGEMLLLGLDLAGVQASAGSACSSGAVEPSHVLLAMGMTRSRAASALRLSLGRTTTADEIERAVPAIVRTVRRVTA
jgi:cysteine desulfurase